MHTVTPESLGRQLQAPSSPLTNKERLVNWSLYVLALYAGNRKWEFQEYLPGKYRLRVPSIPFDIVFVTPEELILCACAAFRLLRHGNHK